MNQIRQSVYFFVLLDRLLITLAFRELRNVLEIVTQFPVFLLLLLLLYIFKIVAKLPHVLFIILLIVSDIIHRKSPPKKSILSFIFFIHIRSNHGQTNQRRW